LFFQSSIFSVKTTLKKDHNCKIFYYYEINRILDYKNDLRMSTKYIKPTESELEILGVLWQRDIASVRDVHEELAKTKDVGYTTTLKLMQIMHEKGLVKRDQSSKTHFYQAAVSQRQTQKKLLGKMIDGLFGGSASQLVIQALGNYKASESELAEIQELLNNMKK
jgi:BlaI family transcriptional regulator, penicillinase repressor